MNLGNIYAILIKQNSETLECSFEILTEVHDISLNVKELDFVKSKNAVLSSLENRILPLPNSSSIFGEKLSRQFGNFGFKNQYESNTGNEYNSIFVEPFTKTVKLDPTCKMVLLTSFEFL